MNFTVQVEFELVLSREKCHVNVGKCHQIGRLQRAMSKVNSLEWTDGVGVRRREKLETIVRNSTHTVAVLPKESVLINENLQKCIWTLVLVFVFVSPLAQLGLGEKVRLSDEKLGNLHYIGKNIFQMPHVPLDPCKSL